MSLRQCHNQKHLLLKKLCKKQLKAKKIGNLEVDPSSLSVDGVQAPDESEPRDLSNGQVPNVKLYVVVACIAALVLVAIIQASCTIFKMSRRGSSCPEGEAARPVPVEG